MATAAAASDAAALQSHGTGLSASGGPSLRLGFIGLGAMGLPIARHLARRHGPLAVLDPDRAAQLSSEPGMRVQASAAQVAAASDVVFLCLPGEAAAGAVVGGPGGLLEDLPAGIVVVDLSTHDPAFVVSMGEKLASAGAALCDAPVFGTPAMAQQARLTCALSGAPAAVAAVRGLLAAFAHRITVTGPLGSASLAKVLQNALGLVQVAAIAEAFGVLQAAGGSARGFAEVVTGSGGLADTALFARVAGDFVEGQARFGAQLGVAAKDAALGLRLAQRCGAPAPLVAQVAAQFQAARDAGLAHADLLQVSPPLRMAPR